MSLLKKMSAVGDVDDVVGRNSPIVWVSSWLLMMRNERSWIEKRKPKVAPCHHHLKVGEGL
jgi:hypothetical protein